VLPESEPDELDELDGVEAGEVVESEPEPDPDLVVEVDGDDVFAAPSDDLRLSVL